MFQSGETYEGTLSRNVRISYGLEHLGQRCTRAPLEALYYWSQLRNDEELYVKTCLICQQDKIENQSPAKLLEPQPIASCP